MAHHSLRSGYDRLVSRLNRFPQGAPPAQVLNQILKLLFSEREAELVAWLPIKPFTARTAARAWKMREAEARTVLDALASRAVLLDAEQNGRMVYTLPPPMAGFFEFSMMRLRGDVDQKLLSQLLYQYLNVEEEFIKALFASGETHLGRVLVNETALTAENCLQVLDYERASEVIRSASHIGIGLCYCRHKMGHLDRACSAPLDICMTFNFTAASLIRHGFARRVDAGEGLDLLAQAQDHHLAQFGENVRRQVNFICHCCGCCCEAMIAQRRFGLLHPIHTSNFLPRIDEVACNGCGQCVAVCPVAAMGLVTASDPRRPGRRIARLDREQCLGCGVCPRVCPQKCITLESRSSRVLTPVNSAHRVVMMAIERGTLANLIFDNRALFSHRAMAAVLGVILKLPPFKQALASRQLKSRYLEALITRMKV